MFPNLTGIYSLTNPDFLAANQQGEITAEQAALLGPAGKKFFKKFQRGSRLNGIVVVLVLAFFLVIQAAGIRISAPMVLGAFGLMLVVLAVQIGGRWARSLRLSNLLEEDLERGEIQNVVGVVQYGKDPNAIHISGRDLRLPLGSKEGLSAGLSHRFYFLPRSGMVLSAEVLEDQLDGKAEDGLTAALVEANGFHLGSLDGNRRGELTREQLPKLYSGLISPLIFIIVSCGVLIYQLSRPGVIRGTSLSEIFTNLLDLNTSTLVIGGIMAALAVWGLILLVRTVMDIAGGQVAAVEDVGFRQTKTSSDEDGTSTTRMYLIGGYTFRVSEGGFYAFEDGRKYRAYFSPRRKTLVNIEVVN